jgi:capsular exopolysaccharide synthesis family protein
MSRIDEALRRAAEEQGGAGGPSDAAARPLPGQDVAALANEAFPIEIEERRRLRAHQGSGGPRPASESRRTFDAGQEAPPPPRPERETLFERIDARLAEKVVADANMSPVSREQYRRLAAVLHDAQSNTGLRVVMVASAVPGEGKTLTAANVALTLSESYQKRVLLVDADLRKPTIHQVFRLNTTSGLIEGLTSDHEVKLVLRQVSPRLSVLPAGRPTSDPMAGLTSERMRHLLEEARETFDWVIVDTPPLMLLPDAHLLSSMVDGALLVVRASATPHDLVKRAADIMGKKVIGVVLNQAEARLQPGYGDYYYQSYYLKEPTGVERT